MKNKPEEITVSGQVLDKETRKVVKHGGSLHTGIPNKPGWKRFLTATLLEVRLVKDEDGEDVIVITKPKGGDL